MIDTITGEPVELSQDYVVVETGGIGYRISISAATRAELSEIDGPVRLFTHLQLREDGLDLYGFARAEERELFRLLLGVTGIGPRLALQVLSAMTPARFCEAVLGGRTEELQRIKGIGRKTAERMILELKDKLPQVPLGEEVAIFSDREELAFQALRSLGFTATEARRAVERAQAQVQTAREELSTEELI
ncbi:MAG: Holliday junction branch migration protein RuvA, partial [Candidatus Bipolaricaulia bacterium]